MMQFNLEGAPEILMVSSDRHPDGRPKGIADAGRYWHTDMSYMAEPALGSLLYARAIPDEGGDTMFCDMAAACRDLPPDKKEILLSARAIHHFASRWARESAKAGMRPQQTKEEQDRNPPVEHPMIRTHPETGEPAIYAGGFVVSIKNAPEELLAWVNDWVAQPKYVYRHKWRLHDLVFWDNRRVMHHATPYPRPSAATCTARPSRAARPTSTVSTWPGRFPRPRSGFHLLHLVHADEVEELLEARQLRREAGDGAFPFQRFQHLARGLDRGEHQPVGIDDELEAQALDLGLGEKRRLPLVACCRAAARP